MIPFVDVSMGLNRKRGLLAGILGRATTGLHAFF
jgi:hypothetical protein